MKIFKCYEFINFVNENLMRIELQLVLIFCFNNVKDICYLNNSQWYMYNKLIRFK